MDRQHLEAGVLMWARGFWLAVLERAIKTAGQAGALALGTFVLTDIDQVLPVLQTTLVAMLVGAVLSLLTSLASLPISGDGPSLGPETLTGPLLRDTGMRINEGDDDA